MRSRKLTIISCMGCVGAKSSSNALQAGSLTCLSQPNNRHSSPARLRKINVVDQYSAGRQLGMLDESHLANGTPTHNTVAQGTASHSNAASCAAKTRLQPRCMRIAHNGCCRSACSACPYPLSSQLFFSTSSTCVQTCDSASPACDNCMVLRAEFANMCYGAPHLPTPEKFKEFPASSYMCQACKSTPIAHHHCPPPPAQQAFGLLHEPHLPSKPAGSAAPISCAVCCAAWSRLWDGSTIRACSSTWASPLPAAASAGRALLSLETVVRSCRQVS